MYTKSDNLEIVMGNETDKIIKELFKSFLQKNQEGLSKSMKGNDFVFDSVDLLQNHFQKISLKKDRSYVNSPKQLKNKNVSISPKNKHGKCFPYAVIFATSYQNIKSQPERSSNIKFFIDQFDWKKIDFLVQQKDQKKFELNNNLISLNILFEPYNNEKIRLAYKSKYNNKHKN